MRNKKISAANKATYVGTGAGVLVTYGASIAAQKYGVPIEVASVVVGGIFGFISRWAGKLIP